MERPSPTESAGSDEGLTEDLYSISAKDWWERRLAEDMAQLAAPRGRVIWIGTPMHDDGKARG